MSSSALENQTDSLYILEVRVYLPLYLPPCHCNQSRFTAGGTARLGLAPCPVRLTEHVTKHVQLPRSRFLCHDSICTVSENKHSAVCLHVCLLLLGWCHPDNMPPTWKCVILPRGYYRWGFFSISVIYLYTGAGAMLISVYFSHFPSRRHLMCLSP